MVAIILKVSRQVGEYVISSDHKDSKHVYVVDMIIIPTRLTYLSM